MRHLDFQVTMDCGAKCTIMEVKTQPGRDPRSQGIRGMDSNPRVAESFRSMMVEGCAEVVMLYHSTKRPAVDGLFIGPRPRSGGGQCGECGRRISYGQEAGCRLPRVAKVDWHDIGIFAGRAGASIGARI